MSLADDIRADIGQEQAESSQDKPSSLGSQMRSDISPVTTSRPEGTAKSLIHGAAALADTALSFPGAIAQSGDYAIRRAFQQSPEQAQQGSEHDFGGAIHPVGNLFGVTDTQGYQNEASQRLAKTFSGVANKGITAVSNATGLPQQDVANMAGSLSMLAPKVVPKIGAAASDIKNIVGEAAQQTAADDLVPPNPTAFEKAKASYSAPVENSPNGLSQYDSAGASSSGLMARLSVASPELQQDAQAAFSEAQAKHGADWGNHIDWNAIDRQLNADSLPVPGRLTRGQATQDGALISEEWNKRNANGLGPTFAAQNENQVANLKAIREQSSPDVYTNTPAEHADTLINAYKDLYTADKSVIDAKWDAIRKQSSDATIFDAGKMLKDAQSALQAKKLTAYDPGGQLAELTNDARRGGLTADGYVAWRQNLGREAMKGGNEGAAASAILDATNKSDMLPEATQYRDMVNDALSSGRALHQKLALDPAYKAVVDGNASVKDFVNKFVVNSKPENVAQMSNNLSGNDIAGQTMRAAVLDNLRGAAALDEQYQGNFAAKSFNKQLSYVTPGARAVFNDGELQTLRSLGDYSTHIAHGGRDSFKNFSNTATELNTPTNAMGKKVGSLAAGGAEAFLAHQTGGASIPVLNVFKAGAAQRAAMKAALEEQEQAAQYVHESTRPAAGFIK